jgi:hypothetical protein
MGSGVLGAMALAKAKKQGFVPTSKNFSGAIKEAKAYMTQPKATPATTPAVAPKAVAPTPAASPPVASVAPTGMGLITAGIQARAQMASAQAAMIAASTNSAQVAGVQALDPTEEERRRKSAEAGLAL